PTAGVTRDRVSAIVEMQERYFELVDTGGYGIVDSDELSEHVEWQIRQAIEKSDLVLFVVDVRDGILPLDKTIAQLLRKQDLNVILVANKADSSKQSADAGEFSRLGFGEAMCVSATNFVNQSILKERILEEIDHLPHEVPGKAVMKIAIVGKRNAGKSTFINAIAGEERVIVSEVPGTTRDAVDVRFERNGQTFIAIDTAGVRKQRKIANDIEFYGYTRVTRSIKRADVVLFMIDSTLEISQVDKKLAMLIGEEHKACIFVINKWDLAKDRADPEDYGDYLTEMLPALKFAPVALTTATEGKNIQSVLDLATEVFKQATTQVPTAKLNKAIERLSEERVGVSRNKKGFPKIYYGTQVSVGPVT
ncbi:hypothetical protein LCGC14_3007670, partial [marine sediment metagenome]